LATHFPNPAPGWIEPLADALACASAFRGWSLRPARRDDRDFLFALHRDAMSSYVDQTWGWDEAWQRTHFAATFAPARQAVIVHGEAAPRDQGAHREEAQFPGKAMLHDEGPPRDVGRVSLTRHWRKIFLRDIELLSTERNKGVGTAILTAVLALARDSDRYVELRVLRCNPAQRLYARLGFKVIEDDGARLRMRAL
jgi:GNAT superfamily N-acetyltransferase